jgi:uncharacterized protein
MDEIEVPLDHIDLAALDDFLSSDRVGPDTMNLSALDGFLHGIVCAPKAIRPEDWLPIVWGGEEPRFTGLEEMKIVIGSIMGHYNEIVRRIGGGECDPLYEEDGDGTLIPFEWTHAFMEAMGLQIDAWQPLIQSPRYGELLGPIYALCSDEDGEPLVPVELEMEEQFLADAVGLIPQCIPAIFAFWKGEKPILPWAETVKRTGPKVGRNDPCPCGSGRKFKKCCGVNDP